MPIVVRDVPDDRLLELALVENIQRQELTPLEEAQAFQRLHEELRLTQEEVARKVGRDRSTVANTLRLLRLPRGGARAARRGRPRRRARPRPPRPGASAEDQLALAREAARKGLSVREVERRVALLRAPRPKPAPTAGCQHARGRGAPSRRPGDARRRSPAAAEAASCAIAFATEAELQPLYELLVRPGRPRPS